MPEKPSIEQIAQQTPVLMEKGYGAVPVLSARGHSDTVDFYQDEIDIKGDGTLWAMAEYEVSYKWRHDSGSRDRPAPAEADYDVTDVRVKNAIFQTDDGEEVEIDPGAASRALVTYFWQQGLQDDLVLADQIHDEADAGSYEYHGRYPMEL